MISLKQYIKSNNLQTKNPFIYLGNMFLYLKNKGHNDNSNKRALKKAVRKNLPICIKYLSDNDEKSCLCFDNIIYPDLFLRKKDRRKKMLWQLQNA